MSAPLGTSQRKVLPRGGGAGGERGAAAAAPTPPSQGRARNGSGGLGIQHPAASTSGFLGRGDRRSKIRSRRNEACIGKQLDFINEQKLRDGFGLIAYGLWYIYEYTTSAMVSFSHCLPRTVPILAHICGWVSSCFLASYTRE